MDTIYLYAIFIISIKSCTFNPLLQTIDDLTISKEITLRVDENNPPNDTFDRKAKLFPSLRFLQKKKERKTKGK